MAGSEFVPILGVAVERETDKRSSLHQICTYLTRAGLLRPSKSSTTSFKLVWPSSPRNLPGIFYTVPKHLVVATFTVTGFLLSSSCEVLSSKFEGLLLACVPMLGVVTYA